MLFSRILKSEAFVYSSYIFLKQSFYGNYSTLDSHTNTVNSHGFATRQDGVENRDKVYKLLSSSQGLVSVIVFA